jgi:hypothetical protein
MRPGCGPGFDYQQVHFQKGCIMHVVVVFLVVLGLVCLTAVVLMGLTWVFMQIVLNIGDSETHYLKQGIRFQKKYGVIVPGLFPNGTRLRSDLVDQPEAPPGVPVESDSGEK